MSWVRLKNLGGCCEESIVYLDITVRTTSYHDMIVIVA